MSGNHAYTLAAINNYGAELVREKSRVVQAGNFPVLTL